MRDGKALRTGGYGRGLTAKVYQRVGTAKAVATKCGGKIVEAYIDAAEDFSVGTL